MSQKTKTLLGALLLVVLLGGAYLVYGNLADQYKPEYQPDLADNPTEQAKEPILAPDFSVFDAEGNEIKLSDFLGKPVVLNFWASWCPPCKSEMPHFNTVYADFQEDVVFMMIDIVDGQRETQAKGQSYVDEQGYTFPIYFDLDQAVSLSYGVTAIPTTLFIDAEGHLITGYQGPIDEETLRQTLD